MLVNSECQGFHYNNGCMSDSKIAYAAGNNYNA